MNQEHNIDRKTEDEKEKFLKMKKKLKYFGIRSGLPIMDGDALYKSEKVDLEGDGCSEIEIKGVLNGNGFKIIKSEEIMRYDSEILRVDTKIFLNFWDMGEDTMTCTVEAVNHSGYNDLFERYGHLECEGSYSEKNYEDEKYSKLLDLFEALEAVAISKSSEDEAGKG